VSDVADQPSQPNDSTEADIEGLLTEAEELTNELQRELGVVAPSPTREQEFFESKSDSEAVLDVQLAQAQAQLTEAGKALGEPPPDTPPDTPPPPKKSLALPPKKSKSPRSNAQEDAESAAPAPSASATQDAGRAKPEKHAGGRAVQFPRGGKRRPAPAPSAASPSADASKPSEHPPARSLRKLILAAPLVRPLHRCALRISALVPWTTIREVGGALGNVLLKLLDRIDRPLSRVNFAARSLMGWISLIFFIAAVSLYFFAVL
jgi:hypothetical protein